MSFIVDTNIISELRKGRGKCHPGVRRWYDATPTEEIHISVIVLGEMRRGVELRRKKDSATARVFERWLEEIRLVYRERILDVSEPICELWGVLSSESDISTSDGLIAATAAHHGFSVVTRNVRDFQRCGVDYVNPFET